MYLLKKVIRMALYYGYLCCYHLLMLGLRLHLAVEWSRWNPWAIAKINMAWIKYTNTTMYEERMKLPSRFHTDRKFENYAEQSYAYNFEVQLFMNLFTMREKLKVLFTPFSCGNKYRMLI